MVRIMVKSKWSGSPGEGRRSEGAREAENLVERNEEKVAEKVAERG